MLFVVANRPSQGTGLIMKELKFTCPSCNQHIECEPSHAGENVPCPACAVLIRVPLDGTVTDAVDIPLPQTETNPFAAGPDDSEKVSYRTVPTGDADKGKPPGSEQAPVAAPETTETPSQTTTDAQHSASAIESHALELQCECPVCQAKLRVSLALESETYAGKTAEKQQHLSLTEREQRIAAARSTQVGSLYPAMKPRLDRILNEGADARSQDDSAGHLSPSTVR